MGLFSAIGSVCSALCSAVSSVCSSIGGAIMGGIGSLAPVISPWLSIAVAVISVLAEIFTEKPKEEKPEELGMKAEQADKKPEDFDSINDYIEYLRQEIKVDDAKLENLSEEERMKYQAVGLGLYVKNIEEKQGMKLDPAFLKVVPEMINLGYTAQDIGNLMQSMKKNGVNDMKMYPEFMKGELLPGTPERKQVFTSVKDMVEQHFNGKEFNLGQELDKLADKAKD
ncbi:hypothetical protein [Phascolarctobacterium succinatutens]|uniref:hypothetical protein n=1 Tax=Phascolarctobacterium succinatutens TaxID=626940 RepID=UPI0023F708E4|nr:hypothetical protein [Phascolarctobacterium succinatutens]